MYKFLGKKGRLYKFDLDEIIMKLNYKCPKDKYVADSFKCGNTPDEAKKNYETEQKLKAEKQKGVDERRGNRAQRVSGKAEKRIAKITDPALIENVKNVRTLIDKAKAELTSGKVSKQTYKELRNAVNTLRSNNTNKNVQIKQETLLKEKSILPSLEKDSYVGISKLKNEIEKAGGPEKYFNKFIKPNSENLKPNYRKPLNTQQLDEKYLDDTTNLTPYKTENDLSFYEIPDYKSDKGKELVTIVALKNGHVAGYARNYQDNTNKYKNKGIHYDGNDAVVSTDLQKSGIGSKLLTELYNKNPEAIKYPGGLTPAGKAATISLLNKISKMEISSKDVKQEEVSSKDQNKLESSTSSKLPPLIQKMVDSANDTSDPDTAEIARESLSSMGYDQQGNKLAKEQIYDRKTSNYNAISSDSKKYINNSKEVKSTLEVYTDIEGCYMINSYLYGNVDSSEKEYYNNAKNAVKNMDNVFKNAPNTKNNMLLWRTPPKAEVLSLNKLSNGDVMSLVGKEITQKGFVSTSRNEKIGKAFGNKDNNFYYEIKLPEGSKALDVSSASNDDFEDVGEVLLNRDATFHVDNVTKDGNQYKIQVTVI